jgi:pimeloyl-ACP methyl ester carboxylesterase
MEQMGLPRFSVAGHDRSGRVAYRMALDHPRCLFPEEAPEQTAEALGSFFGVG